MNSMWTAVSLISFFALSQALSPKAQAFGFQSLASKQSTTGRSDPQFTIEARGELIDEQGRRLAMTQYRAPDGSRVNEVHGIFDSVAHADSFFDRETARAVKVVRRGVKKAREGTSIDRRAEILTPANEPNSKATPAVLWTDGTDYYELTSDSLPNVLSLEQQLSR